MTRRIVLVLLVALAAHAQAPSTFKDGVLAFEKGEWAKAEKLMRETIAVNPRESEGTVSIAGAWYETYVPHYFLARSLAKQGKCDEALKAFAETERQGVTPTISDFVRHLRTRGGCKPAAKAEKPPRVIGEVEVPFEDVPAQATPSGAPPSGATPSGAPSSGAPASSRPLRRLPGGPGRQDAGGPRVDATSVETRARLTTGIRAYLEGQYEVTLRVLDGTPFADRAAAAEAALFRAAAGDALYRIGGEKDDALRAAVEGDLRIYRELRPQRKPDPRIFAPRFIAMTER
ncbi:MAG: tetratricopeptide repeat protein [Thermoanaerobaculia bacterium]